MYSAKEARQRLRTPEEATELAEIYFQIDAAVLNGKRQITVKPFCSYLVWDILEKDYGYTVKAGEDRVVISW